MQLARLKVGVWRGQTQTKILDNQRKDTFENHDIPNQEVMGVVLLFITITLILLSIA